MLRRTTYWNLLGSIVNLPAAFCNSLWCWPASGGSESGPSLTAAARDGRTGAREGTEECRRQAPNPRMPRKRRTCPPPR